MPAVSFFYLQAIILLVTLSCSYQTKVGLHDHRFGDSPRKIIWLQIDGLATEHIFLSKLGPNLIHETSVFESFICQGQTYHFNPLSFKPDSFTAMQIQLTGRDNIKNNCDDIEVLPIWSYFTPLKTHKIVIFESLNREAQSLKKYYDCSPDYITGTILVRSGLLPEVKMIAQQTTESLDDDELIAEELDFHAKETTRVIDTGIYRDTSCDIRSCGFDFLKNVSSVYERALNRQNKFLYLIRDFHYSSLLQKGDIQNAKEYLIQIEKFIEAVIKESNPKDLLLLVTSVNSWHLPLPETAAQWDRFYSRGTLPTRPLPLTSSPAYSWGARAENMCGIYHGMDLLNRIYKDTYKLNFDPDVL